MHDDVCVTSDGTREVGVDIGRETVMSEIGDGEGAGGEVFGREHAAGGENADECIEEGIIRYNALIETCGKGLRGGDIQ